MSHLAKGEHIFRSSGETLLADDPSLNEYQRANLLHLEQALYQHWNLGRNIVLSWCPEYTSLRIVVVPNFLPLAFLTEQPTIPAAELVLAGEFSVTDRSSEKFFKSLVSGTRQVSARKLNSIQRVLGVEALEVKLPHALNQGDLAPHIIDEMVRRYSISYKEGRAVILFDIVGFSLYSPFEQMTQLNSLAYSLNAAHQKLIQKSVEVRFAHSTTGDGFYVWNRENDIEANTNLYHFMHLVLADNAIARLKTRAKAVPLLKTAFLVGNYYAFFQVEELHPSPYQYIVGDATIELARIMSGARPSQVLVGDFQARIPVSDGSTSDFIDIDSVGFIDRLQDSLLTLQGLKLSGEKIALIKCYLTGERIKDDDFNVTTHSITDKHGFTRNVYNAKINIHRESGDPIYLGLQEKDLKLELR